MPPKKKKPEQSETPTEKTYDFLTEEEAKAREQKYYNRIMDLKKCCIFIEDALLEFEKYKNENRLQNAWLDFLTCNHLPKPDIPADIRHFYSKTKIMEKENAKQNMNWLLSVNEKSILSQNIFRQDLTRRRLDVTLRENIGHKYKNYIKDSVEILQRIEKFLDNDIEVSKCPINILDDIVNRKLAIQQEIMDFLDRFTYRIISSENAEMKSVDAISSEYVFNTQNFKMHIWCLKNVAIRFSHLSEPRLLVNFHLIGLVLQIPSNMLKDNLVVRALHMNFDHLSEKAKSFKQHKATTTEDLNSDILDLHDCLVHEWSIQQEMQANALHHISQIRSEYEEKLRQYTEKVEESKKQNTEKSNKKTTKKILKPPKKPLLPESYMIPDIHDEFVREEQKRHEHFMKTFYEPSLFSLAPDEINLRKYFILGGIYQLYYVEKPLHISFSDLNMTWHRNDSKLVIEKDIKILTDSWLSTEPKARLSRRPTKRMTIFEAEQIPDPNIDSPWFIVTIELPEYLCLWGEPTACHFGEIFVADEDIQLVRSEELTKVNNSIKRQSKSILKQDSERGGSTLNTFATFGPQNSFDLKKRRFDSLANHILDLRKSGLLSKPEMEAKYIQDFSLLKTLTKPQIRHIERHIVPRIISSYKFPKEVLREKLEIYEKKPKGKGGKIVRHETNDFIDIASTRQFTFTDRQNNPERAFAKFPEVENLHFISYLKNITSSENQLVPESFAQLLEIVDDIKEKYQLHKNKILFLKPWEQHIKTQNKRIKRMLRKKGRLHTTSASTIEVPIRKRSTVNSLKFDTKSPRMSKKEIKKLENLSENKKHYLAEDTSLVTNGSSVMINAKQSEKKSELQQVLHWTTKYILKSQFDRKNKKIVLYTDRLGNIAFAFKRYEHFPFKNWTMEPSANDPANEVVFTLDTQYVRCVLYITADGFRGHVTDISETYVHHPKMYLIIQNTIKDLKELKEIFKAKNLNIFAEFDANFYIEKGYYCEKHFSTELHTYNCMSVYSTQMHFNSSIWNRLASRRDIILEFVQHKDLVENLVKVRIVPGEACFVDIQESCSDDLDVIKLDYSLTWRNLESYSDLHHLIVSMYPRATDLRCKNSKLICSIRDLLSEIRPLSFS